jgi:adenylate cyclase
VIVGPADVWIEDLGSRNGTFVNGARIEAKTKLADGDMIRVGSLEMRVSCTSPAAAPAPGLPAPTAVPGSAEQPAGTARTTERRLVSVLFADLVGFTRLSRQLEDADLAALVERFESVSADVVAATGAALIKTVGDEILFVADDPGTAAETALGLHDAHARDLDVPEMRVGLASGSVLRRMGDVFGSTVNLASRLTALARPDTTLVDAATAAQLSTIPGLGLLQLAPRRVRGLGVIRVWELRRT